MNEYLQILQGLKNALTGMSIHDIELLFKFLIIGSIGGCLFIIYLTGKIFWGIIASVKAFIDGYKGK